MTERARWAPNIGDDVVIDASVHEANGDHGRVVEETTGGWIVETAAHGRVTVFDGQCRPDITPDTVGTADTEAETTFLRLMAGWQQTEKAKTEQEQALRERFGEWDHCPVCP